MASLPASGPGSQKYIPGTDIPLGGYAYQQGPAPTYTGLPTPTAPTTGLMNSAPEVPGTTPPVTTSPTTPGTPGGGGTVDSGPSAGGSATPDDASFGGVAGALLSQSMNPAQSQAMGPLSLRQGLGNRMYPQDTDALAALRRIY